MSRRDFRSRKIDLPDQEVARLIRTLGVQGAAAELDISPRNLFVLRRAIELRLGEKIIPKGALREYSSDHHERLTFDIDDGWVLVASDAHYWPNVVSTAHRGFVRACAELNPNLVVMNGDVFDGASISRHTPIQWESRPTVQQEIKACAERLAEISKAAKNAERVWTLGNHDALASRRGLPMLRPNMPASTGCT